MEYIDLNDGNGIPTIGFGIPREEVFVTSKPWPQDYAAPDAPAGIQRTLHDLGFDYIDLMLLHKPTDSAKCSCFSLAWYFEYRVRAILTFEPYKNEICMVMRRRAWIWPREIPSGCLRTSSRR